MNMQIKAGTHTKLPLIVAQTAKNTVNPATTRFKIATGDTYECSTGKDGLLGVFGWGKQKTHLIQPNLTDSANTKQIASFSGKNAEKECQARLANPTGK